MAVLRGASSNCTVNTAQESLAEKRIQGLVNYSHTIFYNDPDGLADSINDDHTEAESPRASTVQRKFGAGRPAHPYIANSGALGLLSQ